jgi:hypothetical protein
MFADKGMLEVSGCKITPEQMRQWIDTFFPKQEPFYINCDNELLDQLTLLGSPVYSRAQFSEVSRRFIGEYGANYHHWGVPAAASIVYLEAETLKDRTLRDKLFAQQADLGRGQIYTFDWVRDVSAEWLERLKESHKACDDRIILTHDAWMLLPADIKMKWLLKWLSERVELVAVSDMECGNIPEHCERVIKEHVLTFPLTSGANCFSAAAGAYLGSNDMIENWLNVEQFYEALIKEGLVKCEAITQLMGSECFRPHDVLVWENANGGAIHAAYVVTDHFLFNKMGQFWFQPWQYVKIERVLDYAGCLTNGGRVYIYRTKC